MGMMYCRGCGKELHESAKMCPHCGCSYSEEQEKDSNWMAITAFVAAVLSFLNWFNLPTDDSDLITGIWLFVAMSLGFGTFSIYEKRSGKALSVISIIVAILTALIIIGYQA